MTFQTPRQFQYDSAPLPTHRCIFDIIFESPFPWSYERRSPFSPKYSGCMGKKKEAEYSIVVGNMRGLRCHPASTKVIFHALPPSFHLYIPCTTTCILASSFLPGKIFSSHPNSSGRNLFLPSSYFIMTGMEGGP